jgi:hypothetical protein
MTENHPLDFLKSQNNIKLQIQFIEIVDGQPQVGLDWLEQKLGEYGHQVERFYLPFVDRPDDLFDQILAFRLIDLSSACDRLIAIRPPAHVLPQPTCAALDCCRAK